MTEFKFERKKDTVEDYIKASMFGQNPTYKILLAVLFLGLLFAVAAGIVMFITLDKPESLIITATAIVLMIAYPLFLHFFIKSLTKKLTAESPEEKGVTIGVSEKEILLLRDNRICGKLEWSDITEIIKGKIGFYLTEKEGSAILLGKESVSSGSYEEAVQILTVKKAAMK